MTEVKDANRYSKLCTIGLGLPLGPQSIAIVCTGGEMILQQGHGEIRMTKAQALGLVIEIERRAKEDWK